MLRLELSREPENSAFIAVGFDAVFLISSNLKGLRFEADGGCPEQHRVSRLRIEGFFYAWNE